MQRQTAQLDGHLLDYAVLLASGGPPESYSLRKVEDYWVLVPLRPRTPNLLICDDSVYARLTLLGGQLRRYRPTADWAAAGLILERERLAVAPTLNQAGEVRQWTARRVDLATEYTATEPILAILRCFVALRLGESVDL